MWTCQHCGAKLEDQFDSCWRCSTPKPAAGEAAPAATTANAAQEPPWRLVFKTFTGGAFVTWDDLFKEAAEFASGIGPERVVSISHSADNSQGVVTVWYWTQETSPNP